MLKTLLTLSVAALLLAPCGHAQSRRGGQITASHGSYAHHDFDHHGEHDFDHHGGRGGHGGRYYYYGGVPFFFPFYDIGFGYPGYAYDEGYAGFYGDSPYGAGPYGNGPYQGRIVDQSANGQNGPSLPTVVQQQLAKRGYYKGGIDGKFGPASRSALSRFQHQNGLQETGRIDEPTLMALGFADHR